MYEIKRSFGDSFLNWWVRKRDMVFIRTQWTPSWIKERHRKANRLASLNVSQLYQSLTDSEMVEQAELRRYWIRHEQSFWRQLFL